jgi:hypothetical protein
MKNINKYKKTYIQKVIFPVDVYNLQKIALHMNIIGKCGGRQKIKCHTKGTQC